MPVSVTYAVPDVISLVLFGGGGYPSMGINFEFHQLFQPKSIYTLEGRRPSAFEHPAVGEGWSLLTDFVRKSQRE
jgi:hypothetical protein